MMQVLTAQEAADAKKNQIDHVESCIRKTLHEYPDVSSYALTYLINILGTNTGLVDSTDLSRIANALAQKSTQDTKTTKEAPSPVDESLISERQDTSGMSDDEFLGYCGKVVEEHTHGLISTDMARLCGLCGQASNQLNWLRQFPQQECSDYNVIQSLITNVFHHRLRVKARKDIAEDAYRLIPTSSKERAEYFLILFNSPNTSDELKAAYVTAAAGFAQAAATENERT